MEKEQDPIGHALLDYLETGDDSPIIVKMDITEDEDDELTPSYFFRNYDMCPELEQQALKLAYGKVLDVGAGAGSHALYLQQQRGLDVSAIDVSPCSVEVMKKRGLKQVSLINFYELENAQYDTLLFLMNGVGLVETLAGFDKFFSHAKTLLKPQGQIILDSSDLIYMFEAEDGSYVLDLNEKYHGEVEFNLSYKEIKGQPFKWLYVAEELLQDAAEANGFKYELIKKGPHYDYLAKLSLV